MIYSDFFKIPKQCLLILIDEAEKKAWVNYTINSGMTLGRLYEQVRGLTLTIRVESADSDLETLKLHTVYYRQYLKEQGYEPLLEYGRVPIQYRVRTVPNLIKKSALDVEVVPARGGDGIVVGRFKTKLEAQDFIETYYGADNPLNLPVYAVNSATKEFVLDSQKEMLKLYI